MLHPKRKKYGGAISWLSIVHSNEYGTDDGNLVRMASIFRISHSQNPLNPRSYNTGSPIKLDARHQIVL